MLNALRRLIQRYGFFKREPEAQWISRSGITKFGERKDHPFYGSKTVMTGTVPGELVLTPSALKAIRLAQIARERDALKLALTKAKRDKKAVSPIYIKLRALSVEELNIEAGR